MSVTFLIQPPGISQYNTVLLKMVSASYLKPSTVLSHISPRDKNIQYEAEEKSKIVGFPTAKQLREAKEVARARLKREEEEAEQVGLVSKLLTVAIGVAQRILQKRKAKEQLGPRSNKVRTLPMMKFTSADCFHSAKLLKKMKLM